jgi:Holliday junction DNA helicase RuvA
MFAYIRGILVAHTPLCCTLDVGGIGYRLLTAIDMQRRMPPLQSELLLHCTFLVRELSHTLYGFMTCEERDLFELLLGVSGIGPKLALSIIGHVSYANLQQSVAHGDVAELCRIPGIGRKTAERLLVEMRDKLTAGVAIATSEGGDGRAAQQQTVSDALSALVHLGYTQSAAQKALQQSLDGSGGVVGELPTLISDALRFLSKA